MLKLVMMSLTGLLILFILACGTAAPDEEEAPTAAPSNSNIPGNSGAHRYAAAGSYGRAY